ncbi:CMP-N-acetylneuraminate-poly-alpha-2,8-sialyltransferase-like isoform X1 [Ptychodera flava]|uniref:CMP-N-acetylneuraminate-poly-alpha-2, 8-sialyltransferase-like isoform X1 n=1 Tax=Ptychodera flava TaxID=63121 RepID=UPI00396A21A4
MVRSTRHTGMVQSFCKYVRVMLSNHNKGAWHGKATVNIPVRYRPGVHFSMARNGVRFFLFFLLATTLLLWYASLSLFHTGDTDTVQRKWIWFGDCCRVSYVDSEKEKERFLPRPPDMSFLNKTWLWNEYRINDVKRNLGRFMDARRSLTITKFSVTVGDQIKYDLSPQNFSFAVTKEMYDLLPDESPLRNRNIKNCALVGNSGILLDSACGREINKADFVIRCNFASLKGFETDVGDRTNLFSFNPSVLHLKYNLLRNETDRSKFYRDLDSLRPNVFIWVPAFEAREVNRGQIEPLLQFITEHKENLSHVQLLFPYSVVRIFKGYWMSRGIREPRLSTGLIMYTLALELCQKVTLYGFYPFAMDLHNQSIPYHYDQPRNSTFNYGNMHNFPMEFSYLKKMHEQGVSKLQVGKCR